ncbi:MAG: polyprenyl synthetase family protein [Alphaproteobacteria bacterium]|nr:polyprenyl synthetase family protein [Alphaproteobacteria bacterium]MBL6776697.1 polyprenyl synthetase family protein [Alphaproteobacteria bacterium]
MVNIPQLLQEDATQTSEWLDGYFDALKDASAQHLLAAMRYSAMNGGKRVRASLVLSAARLASSQQSSLASSQQSSPASSQESYQPAHLAVAGAVEMLHAYSLIHDDLPAMDDAELRRGVASCHKAFDEATAILAGDALQTEAFSLLSKPGLMADASRQLELCAVLARASGVVGMAGGQMLDLQAETSASDPAQTKIMQELKTGALIRASAVMGVIIGGGDKRMQNAVDKFASHLGLAFQIADDLLDYQADADQLGKPAGRDAEQGKASFVELLGLEEARRQADSLIEDGCASLDQFGDAADGLRGLAQFVINRNH